MRERLAALNRRKIRFQGCIGGRSRAGGFDGCETILLREVKEAMTGAELTDHVWCVVDRWADSLRPGQVIEFDARVAEYFKGPIDPRVHGPQREKDFHLEQIENVQHIADHLPQSDGVPCAGGRWIRGVFVPDQGAGRAD